MDKNNSFSEQDILRATEIATNTMANSYSGAPLGFIPKPKDILPSANGRDESGAQIIARYKEGQDAQKEYVGQAVFFEGNQSSNTPSNENAIYYYMTDAEGNPLPGFDDGEGNPKPNLFPQRMAEGSLPQP